MPLRGRPGVLRVEVLDFAQFGGPKLTVDSTLFELWMGL